MMHQCQQLSKLGQMLVLETRTREKKKLEIDVEFRRNAKDLVRHEKFTHQLR